MTDDFATSLGDEGTWVHVVGEVRAPGLYFVALGSRVVDAIMAAGGLTAQADECAINLARPVSDGEQLVISTRAGDALGCGAVPVVGGSGGGASSPISLSRADLTALDSLPGIGPTLAQRIIDWRTANGGFTSVDQLNDVSGIGDKLFTTLQPLVTP
jgi:competence protein ComEA